MLVQNCTPNTKAKPNWRVGVLVGGLCPLFCGNDCGGFVSSGNLLLLKLVIELPGFNEALEIFSVAFPTYLGHVRLEGFLMIVVHMGTE